MKETSGALLIIFLRMDRTILNRWILLSLFSIFIGSPRIGGWFCLDGYWQSTVLLQDWLKSLERVLELIEEFVHPDFRWLFWLFVVA